MEKYKYSVKFRLEQRRENPKDKTSPVIKENVPILADITFGSKRIFYFTGHRIDASKWIDKKVDGVKIQQVKKNNVNQNGETAAEINARLRDIRQSVERVFNRLFVNEVPPTTTNVRAELKRELDEEAMSKKPLVEYYRQFIEEESVAATWVKGTVTKHNTIIAHIQDYKKQLYFEDITEDTLNAFVRHLIINRGLSNPYVTKLMKNLKTFLRWATRKGYNKVTEYQDFNLKLKGVSATDKTNIIALSSEQLVHLYNLKIEAPHLQRVRDVFCFCCSTSLRYSDIKNLKWTNVREYGIELVTIKTDDPIVIDFNEMSYALVKKYEPFKDVSEYVFPVISNQKYNDYLKDLGKLAGFDQPQTKVTFRGSERIETTVPMYELLTSHVARKTFVTLSLAKGIPAEIIRSFTGHKDAKVMERYFKFNRQEKQAQMRKFSFEEETMKTVYDFGITEVERASLHIEERDEYLQRVSMDKDLAAFHLAILFQRRGDAEKSAEYAQKLPKDKFFEYVQLIINEKHK